MTDKQISDHSIDINVLGNKNLDASLSQLEKEELKERIIMVINSQKHPGT